MIFMGHHDTHPDHPHIMGHPVRLIMDNFPAAIAGPDALNPRPTRAFREYSLARGLILDPARVRSPRDKPHVENGIRYARERWWGARPSSTSPIAASEPKSGAATWLG